MGQVDLTGRWWSGVAPGPGLMMPSEWHYYVCTRCLATLVIGGQSKGVICPGCDQPMDEMEATSG